MAELPADRVAGRSAAPAATGPSPSPAPSPGATPDELQASRREFERRALRASLIAVAVVFVSLLVALMAWRLRDVLLLIVVSLFFAAVLHPIVTFVERRGLRRGPATGIVFACAVAVWAALAVLLLHPVVTAATHLVRELPRLVRQAEHGKGQIGRIVIRLHLLHFVESKQANLQSVISQLGKPALTIGKSVVSGVVAAVTIFFLTFFLLLELPGIVRGMLDRTSPARAARFRTLIDDVGKTVVGYVLGNFGTSVIAGIVIGATLTIMGVPFPVVLAIWVALVDFLPLIGGLLAGIPTVIIATLHSLPAGIVTLIVFLVYQQVENHLLNPLVMGRTVKLKALYVLLAVLIGAGIGSIVASAFGAVVGALLSVPTAGVIQVVARDLRSHRTGASLFGIGPEGGAAPINDLELPDGVVPVTAARSEPPEVRQSYGTGLAGRPPGRGRARASIGAWARGVVSRPSAKDDEGDAK